ncbi:MAG: aldehyde dehydrogenase [Deltaproteobacteria bacterium]|nr:MAG: aldehyde dehydrogenase [Deltaproteobacteria bacterium]
MRYAETGYNLEVDLTTGNVERVATDKRWTELHLGGLGTNARIMWERVGPDVDPFSEENVIIFSSGLLCGTLCPGANRTIVTSISPQTRLMAFSMMGGFFAPELKYAGYDKVVVTGKAPHLSYIWIDNGRAEIRDARHLSGKGALETAELIRKETGEPDAQVLAIGLAGENQVWYASIEHARSSASRGGLGAVMGSKGLKAIAVRGRKDLNVARPAELLKLCDQVLDYIEWRNAHPVKGVPAIIQGIGSPQEMAIHDEKWHTTSFAWGNARHRRKDFWTPEIEKQWRETQEKAVERLISCYNCPMKCGAIISYPALGVSKYMMKCYTKLTYVMGAMVDDLEFGFKIAGRAQDYGVDSYSAPQVMAFAIELYEAGILTDKDLPDFPEKPEDRFYYLLEKIVHREGIGDVLAKGTYWAAREIGKGAEEYDRNTIKKHEQIPIKLGMLNPIYFLMYSTGEKMNITQIEGQIPQMPFATREQREEFVRDWIQVPNERYKQFFLEWEPRGEKAFPHYPTPEMTAEIVEWQEIMHYIDDSLGLCAGLSSFPIKPPYHIHNLPDIISAATGMEMDEARLWNTARRNRTLIRAFNARRGLRRRDDAPPKDHWKKRFPDIEKKLLDVYYSYKGWNSEGIPTAATLRHFDMPEVAEDLLRRGIISESDNVLPAPSPVEQA